MTRATIAALCLALAGCAGTMSGMVRGTGERVQIGYQQGVSHDDLTITMPDGETFVGKAVMVGGGTSMGMGMGTATAVSSNGTVAMARANTFGVVNTYTGDVEAVLFGNRSRSMQCRLRYADKGGFTSAGGVGVCETSDGRVIDVQW